MDISLDYKDLFRILNKYKVKYLVVGAYAVIFYTEPRYTKDLDISIGVDYKNADKVYNALKEFGASLRDVSPKDFGNRNFVYQIGVAPVRVDIIVGLPGIDFDLAWKNRKKTDYAGVHINMIGMSDLIKSKKKVKRKQDLEDLQELEKKLKRGRKWSDDFS